MATWSRQMMPARALSLLVLFLGLAAALFALGIGGGLVIGTVLGLAF